MTISIIMKSLTNPLYNYTIHATLYAIIIASPFIFTRNNMEIEIERLGKDNSQTQNTKIQIRRNNAQHRQTPNHKTPRRRNNHIHQRTNNQNNKTRTRYTPKQMPNNTNHPFPNPNTQTIPRSFRPTNNSQTPY